ncbi:MAG TPA: universal stress protein [Ktedonobacteraceae bacterium]|jgi:nucleotide-binding universal stress UspA family protein|nr:universal stress protein [Ktedonobacteraceae bacterium]
MFEHILVPLDGSSLAEQALPVAAYIARKAKSTISLFESVPPILEPGPYFQQDVGLFSDNLYPEMLEEAKAYLQRIAHASPLTGITVFTQTSPEAPVQAILGYIQLQRTDLVILCSHGFTGVKRWALGSVAQKVARHSSVPTLIVREKSFEAVLAQQEKARPMRVLVPLDGSQFAEAALLPAAHLVSLINGPKPAAPGELHLVRVVRPPSPEEEVKYRTYNFDLRSYQKDEAEYYLRDIKEKFAGTLASLNLQIVCSIVENGDTADALLHVAETGNTPDAETGKSYDLIAIATHGRGVLQRWVMGSVAERVIENTKQPILVVRPPEPVTV